MISDLYSIKRSPGDDHLGHAVYLLRRSATARKKRTGSSGAGSLERRLATSSIIHVFCGLEALVNLSAHELFVDKQSPQYINPEHRPYLLKQFVRRWERARTMDKLQVLQDVRHGGTLPAELLPRLSELNNMRNWLVHGHIYQTTLLMDPVPGKDREYTVEESEDTVDWRAKFPNTKLNSPGELTFSDALVAFEIVLEGLQVLGQPVLFAMSDPKPNIRIFVPGESDIPQFLDDILRDWV